MTNLRLNMFQSGTLKCKLHNIKMQVNRKAALEQPGPPRLDRNVLKGDRAAKRLRILLCVEIHVLGLRTGQLIDLADVRLRIGEQRSNHTCNVFRCDRRSLALAERSLGCLFLFWLGYIGTVMECFSRLRLSRRFPEKPNERIGVDKKRPWYCVDRY
jgi:hypothetical protein